jgi:signal transduction histidine kinase
MREDPRVELALALLPVGLVLATLAVLFVPPVMPAVVNPRLALVIDAVATLVAVAVAILGWVRYQETAEPAALIRASALLVLAALNALFVVAIVAGLERAFGLSLASPGQLPLWAAVSAKLIAAILFVLAGVAALRDWTADRWPAALAFWLPALAVVGAVVAAAAVQPQLPRLISAEGLARLQADPVAPIQAGSGPLLVSLQALIGLGFLAAAALSYRVYRTHGSGTDAVLAIGLMVAAFSQVHFAIHPGTYASLVTSGDLLRLVFYATLLATLAAERRDEVRALHRANLELVGLREAEVARATVEERARLAREIHDGMSQELWFAKLKQGRLAQLANLPDDARSLVEEVAGAIESALAEARQAILALRPAEGATFAQVVERYVEDFSDRFGIPAYCRCDPSAERLPSRSQAELLRIVQEALNNARKHADATRVRVEIEAMPLGLRMTVVDNGRGFDPVAASSGYGLQSMRERAEIIGATLAIDSRPQDGTRVIVELPPGEPAR